MASVNTGHADVLPLPDKPATNVTHYHNWDPLQSSDWTRQKTLPSTLIRIKKDIMEMYKDPPPGVLVIPKSDDMSLVYALITGPFDTPYEGGFFAFVVRFPPDYPLSSPRVRLLTTGDNNVRFNPNLYKTGKVCLSTLGTWSGPGWSPAQTLASLLVSIQSLMNEKPYHNEPGYNKEHNSGDSSRYNECIQHETIRVAVCDMVEGKCHHCPDDIVDVIKGFFLEYYEHYINVCKEKLSLHGKVMQDPFGENRGKFVYKDLLSRLESLHCSIMGGKNDKGSTVLLTDSSNSDTASSISTDDGKGGQLGQ